MGHFFHVRRTMPQLVLGSFLCEAERDSDSDAGGACASGATH
jgi:hypothetical protein